MENNTNKRDELQRECALMLLLCVFSAVMLALSIQIYFEKPIIASPGAFPTLVSAVMLIVSLAVLLSAYRNLRKLKNEQEGLQTEVSGHFKQLLAQEVPFRTFFMMCMLLIYAVGFQVVGFYIATAVFLLSTMLVFYKGKNVKKIVIITAGMLIFTYLVIELLFKIKLS